MGRSQGEHEAVHPGTKGLVLAGVKPFRRWAAEAANYAIDSKHPYHGTVKIGGVRMILPAAPAIRWAA